ncbi:MAG: hypothetical protein A2X48_21520 [Lentisphaerae bacterium GWF2_49_21]|nr:MAG: hypothetical protein A2X48_21520 [Lentisphaerae bacterium GWF2_49_21]
MNQEYEQQPEEQQMMEQAPQDQQVINAPSYEEIMAAQKITFEDIKAHLTGPVLSFIGHIVIISLLCSLMVYNDKPEVREVQVTVMEIDTKELDKLPEPPPPPEEPPQNVDQNIDVERPTTNSVSTDVNVTVESSVATGQIGGDVIDGPSVQLPNVLMVAPSSSSLIMPGLMAGRGTAGRRNAIGKYNRGGASSSSLERTTTKGLNWLRDHQNADGSWGEAADKSPALTALATLAFLAHGETPSSQEYGTCVLKAIRKLIEFANNSDGNGLIRNGARGYGHSMVAYALSEAFALTKIPMIEEAMNKTITRVVTGQNSLGSYNYDYKNDPDKESNGAPRSDLSVAGWNYQALKAAFAAGCTVKGLETAIEVGKNTGLKKTNYVSGGGFSYTGSAAGGKNSTPTMAAVGTLCLQLFGEGKSKEAQDGLRWLETAQGGKFMKCDWKEAAPTWFPLYQWYYQTQAIFQGYSGTGGNWDAWNKEFQKALMKEQESDGHWSSPSEKYGDKKNEGSEGHIKGKSPLDVYIYSTCLCTLMLEVYYRYLPTFKVTSSDDGAGAAPAKKEGGDLKIE